jgi:tetratricopeptide (TPR) repeat protein
MTTSQNKQQAIILVGEAIDNVTIYGNFDEAVKLLSQAVLLDPENGEIYHNRGKVYLEMERWNESISDFSRAISLSPHPLSYEMRALAYFESGNRSAARSDWERALQLDPNRANALLNLGYYHLKAGDTSKALEYLNHAISVEPTMAKAYENRARLYLERGDRTQASKDLQRAQDLVSQGLDTSDRDSFE